MRFVISILILLSLNACASTMSGNTQPVTIATNVNGAKCTLTNEKGSWIAQTPGSAVVTNSRENLSVRCEKDGYQSAVVSVPSKHKDSATWGNAVLGGGIGYIWDRKTGAAFIYPSTINLTLAKTESSSSGQTDVKMTGSAAEQIKQLNELYKAGIITRNEFTKAKKKILD